MLLFALVLGKHSARSMLRCNASLSLGISCICLPLLHISALFVMEGLIEYWL